MLSAAVLGPAALLAIWIGGWLFAVLAGLAAALMYWEWHGLSAGRPGSERTPSLAIGIAGCFLGPLLVIVSQPPAVLATGAVLAAGLAIVLWIERTSDRLFRWVGFPYIFVCCVAIVWLRELPAFGLETVVWIFLVVIFTDTGAYFTGRAIGGPRLAPRISPKKTWSGLLGGVSAAALVGAAAAVGVEARSPVLIAALSGVLAIVAQIGDLLISKAKRRFDVKDSSTLIPGHGGVLDRLDGFLAVSLATAGLMIAGRDSVQQWL